MDYYTKSVVPIIELNYDRFTTVEKNIASYFINNQEMTDFSAKKVAERLFVSEASLSRFAKKCGYRGYREFIYQYEKSFIKKNESVTEWTTMALGSYQELLNRTYSLLKEEQIIRVCRYLHQYNRVFVCGRGSSGLAAKEMEIRFMRIGVDINAIQDSDQIRMQAVLQRKTNLVIGISISGAKEEIIYLLKMAHKQKAKTVLITANNRENFDEFCNEIIYIPTLQHLNYGNVISPQFPILLIIDIIYTYYVKQDKSIKKLLHDDTVKALKGDVDEDI